VPQSNVELYSRWLDTFNREGVEAILPFFADDAELFDPDLPDGGTYRGREAIRGFIEQVLEGFEEVEVRDYELLPADGDRVVGLLHTYLRGRDGIELEIRDAHLVTFRDGLVARWRLYLDRKEALADAGLDPGLADSARDSGTRR
jgi:ketosteroid isomerase-like protein